MHRSAHRISNIFTTRENDEGRLILRAAFAHSETEINRRQLVRRIASHAGEKRFDTVVGRAFLRAIGISSFDRSHEIEVIDRDDRFDGAERLFHQRYGVAY